MLPRRRLAVFATALALLTPAVAVAAPAARADVGPAGYQVLDNAQKSALDLRIMSGFVPFAETFWRASNIPDPDTGYFLGTGPGVGQPRGDGDVDYTYATLLTALPAQQSFDGVSRATMLDHLIRSIRYTALTNIYSGSGEGNWGAASGPDSDFEYALETYSWGGAAQLIWSQLDAGTQALVRKVVTAEADLVASQPPVDAVSGDTGGETDAWDSPAPALAAVMFPDDPRASTWEQAAIKFALNASSIPGDTTSGEVVDGKPLSSWITTDNLHSDLTLENHGYFNMTYEMVTHLLVNDGAIFYARAKKPLPQAFSFRTQQIWNSVIAPLTTDDGDLISPAGQDWASKDYQWVDYLGEMATRFGSPAASVLESRALQTVAARQAGTGDGSITGMDQLGYEAMLARRISADWWDHKVFTPSPTPAEPAFAASYAASSGVRRWPDVDAIAGRFAGATASMSWDPESPMGTWSPRTGADMTDPVLTEDAPSSLFDTPRNTSVGPYTCTCGREEFATAGTVGSKKLAMAAFPDGLTLLLDQGAGPTFTYTLDQIPGLTGSRPVYSASGTGLGTLSGSWVDVAGRMAMIVAGGGGISAANAVAGSNFGSNDTPLDLTGSTGTGSGDRGAELVADLTPAQAAALAGDLAQPTVPTGWGALQARAADGTDRLVVARWSGQDTATVALTDPRGAPVTAQTAIATGTTATVPFVPQPGGTGAPAATQETIRYFVRSSGPVQLRQARGGAAATVSDASRTPVTVTITAVTGSGTTQTAQRTLLAGETDTATVAGGRLAVTSPSGVSLLVVPDGTARPGEPVTFTAYALNRGATTARAGRLTLHLPGSATVTAPVFSALAPGRTAAVDLTATVPAGTDPWARLTASADLAYSGAGGGRADANAPLTVAPLFTVSADSPDLDLAEGGWNIAGYTVTGFSDEPLTVSLAGRGPSGVSASFSGGTSATIPADGTVHVQATLGDTGLSTGTGPLTLTATAANGVTQTATSTLHFTSDLALNAYGAPWPAASASSSQAANPPGRAIDGDTGDFWVSGGPATAGSGPTPADPVTLGVDFGAAVGFTTITMTPRSGYGPTDYTIQTSPDGRTWTTAAAVTGAPNTPVSTPVTATTRWLRLVITGSHDPTDRNVQVEELSVTSG
jgi:hypothetical protein